MRLVILFVLFVTLVIFTAKSSTNLDKKLDAPKKVSYILKTSWYGPGFHGRKTASGTVYNMYKRTAAHRTWRFGEKLILTNPENNRRVMVTINDRGPYDPRYLKNRNRKLRPHPDRNLDISFQAAKELGMVDKGVADLLVEIVEPRRRRPI